MQWLQEAVVGIIVLAAVVGIVAAVVFFVWRRQTRRSIANLLKRHFRPKSLTDVAVNERQFPPHIRVDLFGAVEDFTRGVTMRSFFGISSECGLGGPDFSSVLDETPIKLTGSCTIGPPQFEHIDVGEDEPVRTLKSGLWLLDRRGAKFALLYAPVSTIGACGIVERMRLQVASLNDEPGAAISREFFQHVESQVLRAKCYRGKVLSFEQESAYLGQATGVKVHRLGKVERNDVILPAKTLELLDRNVIHFVERRKRLGEFQMATRKGLLFYGPPGTGKTYTIRYLAGSLAGHTTFLVSAEQVGLLGEYMTLARLLQPSLVVIEDVDLIARERTRLRDTRSELLLNKLLNEMDGLREDADILFVLTTNRPEKLEAALASRPGRIDQAIEFPLPDDAGREKLARLYSRGVTIPDDVIQAVVKRTEKVSASFIKELMRRAVQFHLERNASRTLDLEDIDSALDEMLFSGGSLNLKLLGAEQRAGDTRPTAD